MFTIFQYMGAVFKSKLDLSFKQMKYLIRTNIHSQRKGGKKPIVSKLPEARNETILKRGLGQMNPIGNKDFKQAI